MTDTVVCPELDNVQDIVAATGVVTGEFVVQPVNDNCACVRTVKPTPTAALPAPIAEALSVPLYVPAAVALVTVMLPQSVAFAGQLAGPAPRLTPENPP